MTKMVILGSCRFEPYEILAVPEKVEGLWNTEEGYEKATEKFHPAMDQADVIIVYAPDGIGEHTQKDIDYARSIGKKVYGLTEIEARIIKVAICPVCHSQDVEEADSRCWRCKKCRQWFLKKGE
jgi:hypothetical protein